MLKKIQRFGGAMFTPVLFFAFAGLVVGLTSVFKNPGVMGSIANPDTQWFKFWQLIEEGGWTVFRQMPLLFAIGLPVSLAKKANARACLETFALYCTFNYFVNGFLTLWGFGVDFSQEVGGTSGLTTIAGIKTLDTSLIGAIVIAGIVVYLHDRFFDTKLPDFLGIFQGSVFVYIVGFIVMIPCALITVIVWPKIQLGIAALQGLLVASGVVGVWIYTFLERILIPTGLHHFIYGPFIFGPAVVENGITAYWTQHIQEFSSSMESLKVLFPQGGFALHGNSKIFGCTGIALALYVTAKPSKKKIVAGLLIPAVLTAVVSGITEPLEFTFLFIAPVLFAVHSILAATMAAVMYAFGVVGNFGGGLLDFLFQNWIPMFKNHSGMMFTQIAIGFVFTAIYFFVFKFLIEKMNLATPGREEEEAETKLYTKADYKAKKSGESSDNDMYMDQAIIILEALGGKENIEDLNNCATRLRVSVKDEKLLHPDSVFKQAGAHGVVKKGKAIQVIIGLSVPQVRDRVEELIKK
ncbi:hypothetical protein EII29_03655 [Leptotrichia sp. OH3620_COT-345]|uniref:alpha-glucoside-specific PTS transporter subunit IIBC n=1 Tax=Leptotrichia sp. OH3620_COT-345 TaxID=2491048 RepID=UPI000F6530C8|nr:alpha-glucoside-specific PTS transporter subunit IIBC [Leptotrichia sp. OH3620_COT-345]RRD40207.1 hypothetical protein EII29_03655 [Leptotrichia sp. OH3620_COT-345]